MGLGLKAADSANEDEKEENSNKSKSVNSNENSSYESYDSDIDEQEFKMSESTNTQVKRNPKVPLLSLALIQNESDSSGIEVDMKIKKSNESHKKNISLTNDYVRGLVDSICDSKYDNSESDLESQEQSDSYENAKWVADAEKIILKQYKPSISNSSEISYESQSQGKAEKYQQSINNQEKNKFIEKDFKENKDIKYEKKNIPMLKLGDEKK